MSTELQEFLKKHNITESQQVIGNLTLMDLTSIPKCFNTTVGGSLYLDSLPSIPKALIQG
jgi:hypothetical protein